MFSGCTKAYHKANGKRKSYLMEVTATKRAFDYVRSTQKMCPEVSDIAASLSHVGQVYFMFIIMLSVFKLRT